MGTAQGRDSSQQPATNRDIPPLRGGEVGGTDVNCDVAPAFGATEQILLLNTDVPLISNLGSQGPKKDLKLSKKKKS